MVLSSCPSNGVLSNSASKSVPVLRQPVLPQGAFWPLCLRLAVEFSPGAMGTTLRTGAHSAVLVTIARSDEPTQNPVVPGFECPHRRNSFPLGTGQGDAVALCRKGLQAGPGRSCPRRSGKQPASSRRTPNGARCRPVDRRLPPPDRVDHPRACSLPG